MSDEPVQSQRRPIEPEPAGRGVPRPDRHRRIPEPPPVTLVSVADVVVACAAGKETQLADFYCGVLGFERDEDHPLAFWADNHRIIFRVGEGPARIESLKTIEVEVGSLDVVAEKLLQRGIDYERQADLRTVLPYLALIDPAGHPLVVRQIRPL